MKYKSMVLSDSQPILSLEKDGKPREQNTKNVSIHYPEKIYKLIGNNIFHKAEFMVGEKSSLLFINSKGETCSPDISVVINNPEEYTMVYPIPIIQQDKEEIDYYEIESLDFTVHPNAKVKKYYLTFENGLLAGKSMFFNKPTPDIEFMRDKEGKNWWPNKNVLLNSNSKFIIGFLIGYLREIEKLFPKARSYKELLKIKTNQNNYVFSNLLNLLGANYKIMKSTSTSTSTSEFNRIMEISLPSIFKQNYVMDYLKKENSILGGIFRNSEYWYTPTNKNLKHKNFNGFSREHALTQWDNEINRNIYCGEYILIPVFKVTFQEVKHNNDIMMFDFTSNNPDCNNFAFLCTPYLKNSDGDILTIAAVHTQEAIEENAKHFRPDKKNWFRGLNEGKINNYISDDALNGLFNITKHLSK